ncbi:hypothetical protein CC85DRAFT_306027 [Cutaneotrichosporon oleaginosum]|uniref:Uncharacterized protein n=1 Tax=Cutaneotrichosporon oleaginosum TaxID=879819 RepID=A0A0J0XBB0_9TREE|nr:uncharacterized protein CC85DRAFT_306027 [Cutaneotrichosporon oleaginosum]KLT38376.1 hypothetical protein CC85DRAFT_306027 [Cutaneotrichosporon oleaginosum]TXT07053.1 hypothetical protein COLE_06384 [Cutaneotrichosporon oleaginosum]
MTTFAPFQQIPQPLAGMSTKPKRKRTFDDEPDQDEVMGLDATKHLRTLPPSVEGPGGFAFPINMPDLVADASTSASASDVMDHDMDFEMDDAETTRQPPQYSYAEGGSGGFMFGPGADEDEMSDDDSKGYPNLDIYPATAMDDNPSAFYPANVSPQTAWSAQSFATNLAPPVSPGLMQPSPSAPLGEDATPVELARSQHGPQCTSIPKLKMSDYPDPSGGRSLWAVCPDCGAMERAS